MKKFLSIFMTVLCMVAYASTVMATVPQPTGGADALGDGASNFVSTILGVIQWVGYGIAVGMLIYVGIKYVMASANEKADLKNAMFKYVIGAVLIAGAASIAQWVINLGTKANG